MEPRLQPQVDKDGALERIRAHWLSRAVHDMRGPLFAARGYARLMLREDRGVTVTQRPYVTQVLDNMNRLSELVSTLQEFPSASTLDLVRVSLRELLSEIVACIRQRAAFSVYVTLPADPVWTAADGAKLAPAVHKLLTLAVDFSQPETGMEVRASQEHDELTVRCIARAGDIASLSAACSDPAFVSACRILRLHAGAVSIDTPATGALYVTLRIPLIHTFR